ncbi:SDR family NAD(P)-dependent oxidoreductase [Nocardia sp. NPDC050697]|uniref:SDR family NAD(P)-dependent oxidoreductase n=1 Tax=Nocardia sp. NPDC050697 TaxID=3155158 RepID=UPI0033EDF582
MTTTPFPFTGARAVLTGAASGLGEQLAHQLAARGTHLVLADRDAERLAAVATRIRAEHPGLSVAAEVVDLADLGAVVRWAERLAAEPLDLLINNAGVALRGSFGEVSAAEFDWVMAVNFQAPVALCRALLPALRRGHGGHIVNVSSVFGLIGVPGQPAYCASKYALRGFGEVLRQELEPDGIGVTTVFPGGVRTRIAETARVAAGAGPATADGDIGSLLTFPADRAATLVLEGVARRRARVLVCRSAVIPDVLARLLPVRYPVAIRAVRAGLRRRTAPVGQSPLSPPVPR